MITRGGMSEIIYYKKIRELGLSEEFFYSLPYECQRAIMMAGTDSTSKTEDEFKKRMALKQYNFEEKVKEKILSLFKKK